MKKILLLGDVIRDFNLMEYPPIPTQSYQSLTKTMQYKTYGGVLYLREIIKNIMPETMVELQCFDDALEKNGVQVFNTWKQFPKSSKDKSKVWRINRFIGRTEPDAATWKSHLKKVVKDASKVDFLLIDDLDLGCMKHLTTVASADKSLSEEKTSPLLKTLLEKTKPEQIILKLSSFSNFQSLIDCNGYSDKMTVVIGVHTLRERGAAISEGLSWDQTIEDTVQEFESGISSFDLAYCRRVVVLFSAEGAAVFEKKEKDDKVSLVKFLYHPSQYEGSFKANHPGKMSGNLSLITSAIVRHLVLGKEYPLFVALSLTLTAIRKQYEDGIQENLKAAKQSKRFDANEHIKALSNILSLADCSEASSKKDEVAKKRRLEQKKKVAEKRRLEQKKKMSQYLNVFSSSFQHDLLKYPPKKKYIYQSNLLGDFTGYKSEYVAAKAFQIVMQGAEKALSSVPIASYGAFLTADREEIERINGIKKLIVTYLQNPQDRKPLSIAVFGPPGSGKSFSIKQLAAELGFDKKSIQTFNLSEFKKDSQELQVAFQKVRDASIQGNVPLIFWDEFDSNNLDWLKEFLAPMQDAEFRAGSIIHPLGKAIFVFAGGVFSSFEEFEERTRIEKKKRTNNLTQGKNKKDQTDEVAAKQSENVSPNPYEGKKAQDFISRLRGYVNIKGPNPQESGEQNSEYLIRRAIIFRSTLQQNYSNLLGKDGQLSISAPVVQAFLRIKKFKHGARSLESIVNMSNIVSASFFGEAALPPYHLLNIHVDAAQFRQIMREEALEAPMIELIAEACHMAWKKQKDDEGYEYGPVRSDEPPKRHPLLIDYQNLDEENKEGNRITARLTQAKLRELNLEIDKNMSRGKAADVILRGKNLNALMHIEHDIWMRDHLLRGYEYDKDTKDDLKLHSCLKKFDQLTEKDKNLDKAIVMSLREVLKKNNYGVRKIKST